MTKAKRYAAVKSAIQFIHDELTQDLTRWTQGSAARNALGEPTLYDNPYATCWCPIGWISRAAGQIAEFDSPDYQELYEGVYSEIISVLKRRGNKTSCSLIQWNDNPKRTVADVVSVVKEALAGQF